MPKLLPKRRAKITIYLDQELYAYFTGLRYSPTEDRLKYGFSDMCNRLLWAERDRQITLAREANLVEGSAP